MASVLIETKAASAVATPSAGYVEIFYDSENNNRLSYKDSSGNVVVLQGGSGEECCACEISERFWEGVMCALNNGLLTAAQFQTLVNTGFSATASEVTDNLGNTHCTVNSGPLSAPVTEVEIETLATEIAVSGTVQLIVDVLPANANQNVIYVSSAPSKATVSSTGLVTGVASGEATIYVYSAADLSKFDTVVITVT